MFENITKSDRIYFMVKQLIKPMEINDLKQVVIYINELLKNIINYIIVVRIYYL